MKAIIYTRPDGGLTVVRPTRNTYPAPETLTDDEIVERAWKRLPADAVSPAVVEESAIPTDRTFRGAWKEVDGSVEHDMDKCREIHKDRLRALREPLFEVLDVAFMRAIEQGLPTTEIVAEKQALRDVTIDPAIATAASPEELKSVVPEVLKP